MKKILILLLIIFTVLPLAVSCEKDKKDNKESEGQPQSGETDRFAGVDFDGETITMSMSNSQDPERMGVSTAKYMTGIEDDGTINYQDTIVRAFRERNEYVQGRLNLKLDYNYISDNYSTVYATVMQKYNAHDGFADAVCNMETGMARCCLAGIFSNCNRDDLDNYFDFTTSNWYKDILDSYSLSADLKTGKIYLLASDFFIDFVRCLDVTYVNEVQMATLGDDALANFYQCVEDGEWTYDNMAARVNSFFVDKGTTPGVADEQDTLGLVFCGHGKVAYTLCNVGAFYSCDLEVMVDNGSGYTYGSNRNAISRAIDKIALLFASKGAIGIYSKTDAVDSPRLVREQFVMGNSLFCMGLKLYDLENELLSNMKVCPVPFPKVNEEDDYHTYVHSNVSVGAILKTGNFEPLSAYIEFSTEKSAEPRLKYYEKGLGLKYETGTNTKKMLDIIYEGICIPIHSVWETLAAYENNEAKSYVYILENSCRYDNNLVESSWASYGTVKENALKAAIKKYQALS